MYSFYIRWAEGALMEKASLLGLNNVKLMVGKGGIKARAGSIKFSLTVKEKDGQEVMYLFFSEKYPSGNFARWCWLNGRGEAGFSSPCENVYELNIQLKVLFFNITGKDMGSMDMRGMGKK